MPRILGEVGRAQSEYSSAGWVAVFVSLILDSGWAWAALAFALGWLTGTSARLADAARSGALSGATGLLVATPAYYATDLLFGIDGGSEIGYWVARALVFGLPLGVAGALARRPGPIGFLARLTVPVGTAMSMVMFPMRTGRPGESSAAIWAELTIWAAVVVVTFRLVWIQRRRRAHAVTAPKHASEATRTLESLPRTVIEPSASMCACTSADWGSSHCGCGHRSRRRDVPRRTCAQQFTAFAPGAIDMRLRSSRVRHVISEPAQSAKLNGMDGVTVLEAGAALDASIDTAAPLDTRVAVGGRGQLVELYTSGTTGLPKGVPVPVRALAAFRCYMHYGLDAAEDDVFWNAADPGWAYGLYYAILGPLAAGRADLLLEGGFDARQTYAVIEKFGVSNFAGAPTMYRSLINVPAGETLRLRRASSAGEPLTPDVMAWAAGTLGTDVRDHYGQTEQGMVIANAWHDALRAAVKPGSMGRALPGFAAGVIDGQIALDTSHSPLMWFEGYVDAPERTAERFTADGRWYLTSDTGRVDADGDFFFTARNDDVILAAGYRIGPFDVESVLITHPAVAEVAVERGRR